MNNFNLKDTKLGIFPISWEFRKVKDLINEGILENVEDGNHGAKHPKEKDFLDRGIPFIAANDIRNGKLDLVFCKCISEDTSKRLRKGFSISGDVLLTHKGTIGRTAIVPNNIEYIVLTPQVTYYRVSKNNKKLVNFYLKYFFDSLLYQSTLKRTSKQSTRDYIGINRQKELYILIPSILEQNKIASILSTVDDLIESTTHLINSYTLLKKGLMQTLLTKGIGHSEFKETSFGIIPSKWEIKKLGYICDIYQPKTITSRDISDNGPYKVYGANGVIGYYDKYNHEESEVLVTCRGATCGSLNFSEEKSWITGNAMVIKPITNEIRKRFLYFLLMFLDLSKVIDGSAQPQITRASLSPFLVYIPSIEEQDKISLILLAVDEFIKFYINKKETLLKLKKGLMQQLLTGRIRVKV